MAVAGDIFGRADSPFAGAFSAESSRLSIAGADAAKQLVQDLNVNYQQPVQAIYEVGSNYRYYVVGRTSGNMGIGQILGPSKLLNAQLELLGNPCSGSAANKLIALNLGNSGCSEAGIADPVNLYASACVAMSAAFGMNSQDLLLRKNVQVMFGELSYNKPGDQAP